MAAQEPWNNDGIHSLLVATEVPREMMRLLRSRHRAWEQKSFGPRVTLGYLGNHVLYFPQWRRLLLISSSFSKSNAT